MKKFLSVIFAFMLILSCSLFFACDFFYGDGHVHEYTAQEIPPTCTIDGCTRYTCECGDSYEINQVVARGHEYEIIKKRPNCSEFGGNLHLCDCGDSYLTEMIMTKGFHDYKSNNRCYLCGDNLLSNSKVYDFSEYNDGSIYCYLKSDDNGLYDAYVVGNGKIKDFTAVNDMIPETERTCIKAVCILDGITGIGSYAFSGFSVVKEITFTKSVTSIGEKAFNGCNLLKEIYFNGDHNFWNAVEKNQNWKAGASNFTVYCDDAQFNY